MDPDAVRAGDGEHLVYGIDGAEAGRAGLKAAVTIAAARALGALGAVGIVLTDAEEMARAHGYGPLNGRPRSAPEEP